MRIIVSFVILCGISSCVTVAGIMQFFKEQYETQKKLKQKRMSLLQLITAQQNILLGNAVLLGATIKYKCGDGKVCYSCIKQAPEELEACIRGDSGACVIAIDQLQADEKSRRVLGCANEIQGNIIRYNQLKAHQAECLATCDAHACQGLMIIMEQINPQYARVVKKIVEQ